MTSFHELVHHATLERELQALFPKQLFLDLELPESTHFTMYQGLPRDLTNPLLIQAPFTHLPSLKQRILDKAILSLYRSYPYKSSHKIMLLTYVIPGGLGDYSAQICVQQLLQSHFPHLTIKTFSWIHATSPLAHTNPYISTFLHEQDLAPSHLSKALLQEFRESSLLLQLPTFHPQWNALVNSIASTLSRNPLPLIETLGEYGFIQSENFHLKPSTRCLGLHFLEHGLLVTPSHKKLQRDPRMLPPHLAQLFLYDRQNYTLSTRLFFTYLCTEHGHALYFYSLLLYLSSDSHHIDLVTPDIGPFLKILENSTLFLKKAHIQKVHIYYLDKFSSITVQETGKILRVFHLRSLSKIEFHQLLMLSDEPVGIRGNLSLSEAISYNKSYFYDPLHHNMPLYYSLTAMAKHLAPAAFSLLKLYKPEGNLLDKAIKIADLMRSTQALDQLKSLNLKIQQDNNAAVHLENLVYRALCHYEHPVIRQQEEQLMQQFCNAQISAKEMILSLKTLVQRS